MSTTQPEHTIYIPSKGRWERPMTARALRKMGVPFKIVVEPDEADNYRDALGGDCVLVLPFGNLGQGSIPARNWIWEHSLERGDKWHWIIDDNVDGFCRVNHNRRIPVYSGAIFKCVEDFTKRYENVSFSGMNYRFFVSDRGKVPAFYLNTRVYSITLIRNDLPYRWRGRYNEDTDICLRALKDGWCTLLLNVFVGNKAGTLSMKGGNTDTVYATNDHRLEFAESLKKQHPDVVEVVWKFGRYHHQVDYSSFRKNKLRLREGIVPTQVPNEYGMVLRRRQIVEAVQENRYNSESITETTPDADVIVSDSEGQSMLF